MAMVALASRVHTTNVIQKGSAVFAGIMLIRPCYICGNMPHHMRCSLIIIISCHKAIASEAVEVSTYVSSRKIDQYLSVQFNLRHTVKLSSPLE